MNVECDPNESCPPIDTYVFISSIDDPRFVSINYLYLIVEAIIAFIISMILVGLYNKIKK